MKEFVATISSKGQVTIPADVRHVLGVEPTDKIAFVVEDDEGSVALRPVRYTLESVLGSIRALPDESADLEREIEAATAENADRFMSGFERR